MYLIVFVQKKKDLDRENEELNETVQSSGKQNERLTSQLKEAMTRNAEEQDQRRKLETQLEKVRRGYGEKALFICSVHRGGIGGIGIYG